MAGSVTSPANSSGESVDSLVTSAGTTGIMKGAVGSRSVSGGVANVAAQEVATQVDDATFTPATSLIVVVGALADETASDSVDEGDGGALRMTVDRHLLIKARRAPTGTKSNVADAAASTTILAANVLRMGATIWNDSTSILYLDLSGGTATATSCSKKLAADEYYEVPYGYTGLITGIWSSDSTGSARVTEFV